MVRAFDEDSGTAAGKPVAMLDPFKARLDVVEKAASSVAAVPKR